MIDRIEFSYSPGYFSSFINLDNISLAINSNSLSYKESFFDEVEDIEGHLSEFSKEIKKESFNELCRLIEGLLDYENDYEYYDSEITEISIINTDSSINKIDIYCNFNKNERLIPLVKLIEDMVGKEYLLPSMQYVEDDNYEDK